MDEREKKWVVFVLLASLMVGTFVAVNRYWFYPHFSVHVPPPPRYTPPEDRPEIIKIRPFERTMKYITSQGHSAGTLFFPGRNPFLWKNELTRRQKKKPPPSAVEVPRLGMILISGTRRRALLDNSLVSEGEQYKGHLVEKIEKDGVILSGEYGRVRLFMPSHSLGPAGVEIVKAKNPNLKIHITSPGEKR